MTSGISAQHALATSHAQAIAGLQSTSSDHEGRLAAVELSLRSAEASARERNTSMEERIGAGLGTSAAKPPVRSKIKNLRRVPMYGVRMRARTGFR